MPSSYTAVHLLIHGRVQGVGYRYFVQETAEDMNLSGWVRNLPDGDVEAYGEGKREVLEAWIMRLREGPPLSRVVTIQPAWQTPQGSLQKFFIR